MNRRIRHVVPALAAAIALVLAAPATFAQTGTPVAPTYGSGAAAGALSNQNFNTPESDGRPGVKFFGYGSHSYKRGDYQNAVYMFKLSAYWAYEPAAYNLGVMYFNGKGVTENRPLGAAWMVFAAERGNRHYVKLRDMMLAVLSKDQIARTSKYLDELRPKYGNTATMHRAKWQWKLAKNSQTGSRLGANTGELRVGAPTMSGAIYHMAEGMGGKPAAGPGGGTYLSVLSGGSVDGSVAYRQFQESSDPYAPIFLKNRKGEVEVAPLQPAEQESSKHPSGPQPST